MTSVKQELPSGNAESAAMNSNAIWRAHCGEVLFEGCSWTDGKLHRAALKVNLGARKACIVNDF